MEKMTSPPCFIFVFHLFTVTALLYFIEVLLVPLLSEVEMLSLSIFGALMLTCFCSSHLVLGSCPFSLLRRLWHADNSMFV